MLARGGVAQPVGGTDEGQEGSRSDRSQEPDVYQMTARRVVTRAPFQRRQRTATQWARIGNMAPVTFTANQAINIAVFVLANAGIGETVRRTRGIINVQSDQTANAENQVGALGAIVVLDAAITAGVASLPKPLTDQDDDGWLLWVPVNQMGSVNIGSAALRDAQPPWFFDSKAMRKIEDGFSLVFIFESFTPGAMVVSMSVSVLSSRL